MKPDTQPAASYDAIDSVLSSDQELVPTSGFLATVMERVREESIVPKPIPFPWKLAVPGMVLAAATIGWLIYEFIRTALAGDLQIKFAQPHLPATELNLLTPAMWIAIALLFSLASWAFSRRLIRRSSLL
jgi:hypothetical protein